MQPCVEMQCGKGCEVETTWHLGKDVQVKNIKKIVFLTWEEKTHFDHCKFRKTMRKLCTNKNASHAKMRPQNSHCEGSKNWQSAVDSGKLRGSALGVTLFLLAKMMADRWENFHGLKIWDGWYMLIHNPRWTWTWWWVRWVTFDWRGLRCVSWDIFSKCHNSTER